MSIFIDAQCYLEFDAKLEREAMDEIAESIAPLFSTVTNGDRVGLIVASDNAGTATSVQFWAQAVRIGLALASPELFPWCLANAPCGSLARRFGITGPNSTYLGEREALFAALDTAKDWLIRKQVDQVMLVSICFASELCQGTGLGLRIKYIDTNKTNSFLLETPMAPSLPSSLRGCIEFLKR